MQALTQNIRYVKGVGEKRAKLFEKLGVFNVGGLLSFYPYRYIDYSNPFTVAEAPYGILCVVQATVFSKGSVIRTGGGKNMVKVIAGDETATLTLTFFNNPYAVDALEIGEDYLFYGKFDGAFSNREAVSPTFIQAGKNTPLTPVYHLTEGLSSKYIASCIKNAFTLVDEKDLQDPLPSGMLQKYNLPPYASAVKQIHFPQSVQEAETARNRFIFEELLLLQLGLLRLRGRERKAKGVRVKPVDLTKFFGALPFTPTGAQQRAVQEIVADMAGQYPMNRLLQGDVGSGKTLVAAAAMYASAQNGLQSALMAPTELLAQQHAETFAKLLAPHNIQVALLTGSTKGKARKTTLQAVQSGQAQVIIGTHALISEDVEFNNLALTVTDEQHRFGVRQRTALALKGAHPHLLVMSATPIPRTLGLVIFGDLDISVLDEMPPGRTPVKTHRVDTGKRKRMFGFIEDNVKQGRQAYIVCPVIDESVTEMQAVTTYYEEIAKPLLPGVTVGLLHGRMKPQEKAKVMQSFAQGEVDVLCSTTVIEVGVDVPNATIMVIENAERFGLSALHQLRGRVGRGKEESYCFLVSDHTGENVRERLALLASTNDGFEVARYDLETRGPGDFFGKRQHGLPNLKVADLVTDAEVLAKTQAEANAIIKADADLSTVQNAKLKQAVENLFEQNGDELLN